MSNKISKEELEKLNQLVGLSSDLTYNLGVIEIHLNQAKTKKDILLKEYFEVEKSFKDYSKELKEKYGDKEISLTTGEIKD